MSIATLCRVYVCHYIFNTRYEADGHDIFATDRHLFLMFSVMIADLRKCLTSLFASNALCSPKKRKGGRGEWTASGLRNTTGLVGETARAEPHSHVVAYPASHTTLWPSITTPAPCNQLPSPETA